MWRVFSALFIITVAIPAMADAADGQRPGTDKLPSLEEVRPLAKSSRLAASDRLIHNLKVSAGLGLDRTTHASGEPTPLKQTSRSGIVGLSFGVSDVGFVAMSGSFSRVDIDSQVVAFPLALDGNSRLGGFDATIGITPLPYLRFGLLAGWGDAETGYNFTDFAAPEVGSTSSSRRVGFFGGASYPIGPVMLTGDVTYLRVFNKQSYDPGNIPASASWGTDLMVYKLGASYEVVPKLTVSASVAYNQILRETVAPAEQPMDRGWGTLQLGAEYMVTDNIGLNFDAATWFGNEKYNYQRLLVGASYKF